MSSKSGVFTLTTMPDEYFLFAGSELRDIVGKTACMINSNNLYGGIKKLAVETGISRKKLNEWRRRGKYKQERIRLNDLKLLIKLLEKNDSLVSTKIERRISAIGLKSGIQSPHFPIDFASSNGAIFLADLLTDGSLGQNGQVFYSNSLPAIVCENINAANELFTGKRLSVENRENLDRERPYHSLKALRKIARQSKVRCATSLSMKPNGAIVYGVTYTKAVGKFFDALGIPRGKRVFTNPGVPDVINRMSEETLGVFIGRVILNEGHVEAFKNPNNVTGVSISHSIDVTNNVPQEFRDLKDRDIIRRLKRFLEANRAKNAPKLLWAYKEIVEKLGRANLGEPYIGGIYTTKGGQLRAKWNIYISGWALRKVFSKIEASLGHKRQKLQKYLENVYYHHVSAEARMKQILEIISEIQGDQKYFTVKDVATHAQLSIDSARKYLALLSKMGVVCRGRNRRPYKYQFKPI